MRGADGSALRHVSGFSRGFTLIELLIVVAVIAILAAIAVPNFLEAQTRAKVSRTVADMRSLAVAIEAYQTDQGTHSGSVLLNKTITTNLTPGVAATPRINAFVAFTTPVAHISSVPADVFNVLEPVPVPSLSEKAQRVLTHRGPDFLTEYEDGSLVWRTTHLFEEFDDLVNWGDGTCDTLYYHGPDPLWALLSVGPDHDTDVNDPISEAVHFVDECLAVIQPYDPTNGTESDGDIVRFRQ
jgi:prepilin-type N-terminal cleavage/methylation domain-containing protein